MAWGPRRQPSATESEFPDTSNTLPVTPLASSLQSHTAVAATQIGDIAKVESSSKVLPMSGAVKRVSAPGARQLTVTPYFTSSIAEIMLMAAMPALAAP